MLQAARGDNPDGVPSVAWVKTRKGRGYGIYDNKSHGVPHKMNAPGFWEVRKAFMKKYGVEYEGVDQPAPDGAEAVRRQAVANFGVAVSVLHKNDAVFAWADSERNHFRYVVGLGRSTPQDGLRSVTLAFDVIEALHGLSL